MLQYFMIFILALLAAYGLYAIYERLFSPKRKTDSSLYVEALRDLLDGKQEAAFTKLRQVVTSDSGNTDAYLRLGQILRNNKQPERALQVHKDLTLRRDLSIDERKAVLRHIAEDCLTLGDVDMAEKAVTELISMDPRDHWAHTRFLHLQEKAQRWDQAYDTAVHILKLEANKSKKPLARFKFQAGQQLLRQREFHKARILYKEAIGLDPTLADAYLSIGDSYRAEERLEDAVTFWNKLIETVPHQGHLVIDRLKKTLFDLGRFGDIQDICQSILKHSPRNVAVRFALAEFHEKKGDNDQAVELLEQIVEDHPEKTSAVFELIRMYLDTDRTRKIAGLIRSLEDRRDADSDDRSDTTDKSPAGVPS